MRAANVSQRLVIDASVARSAGPETATFPRSKRCRDLLKTTLAVCHRVVITPAIRDEWNRHQSRFAKEWRTAMVARKKLLFINVPEDLDLRGRIEAVAGKDRDQEAMLKDVHLVEAAHATDRTVISLDDTVRDLFAEVSRKIRDLRTIVWVNPDEYEDGAASWLEGGALPVPQHQLDARRPSR